ncbi:CBS domain-containing protein [Streptomyces sp. VB1]|uniref:CBS domain-containing protein n=1 Tax=Streptomyces sp. VB1 TaxID=2986803 RepID=UPI002241A8A3|nr:CBS domain-containing protein [Streptomyces sp. VB1]UZI28728.1 CBS domain-containing protein [Streptomyces sp. VB1]
MPTPDDATVTSLEGTTVSIRDLLSRWGFRIRDHASVPQIRIDLTNVGLTTVPDFATGPLDDEVEVVPIALRRAAGDGTEHGDGGAEKDPADTPEEAVGKFPQAAMRVQDLQCADRVTSITPDETLSVAMGRMAEFGYSQLPVIDASGALHGVITWASIAHIHPFFVLGEIERRLRRCLGRVYDDSDVQKVHKKRTSVDELMFGEYIRLLDDEERWAKLGWPLVDRDHFVGLLGRVKDVRNTVMHFNAPALRPEQLDLLDSFVSMLRLYDPDYGVAPTA